MKKVSVSIVIPNWNGAKLLQKNLPFVVAAGKNAEEIIVVDDGSTDNSVNILTQFPEIKIIKKTLREGFSSTVNVGVSQAKGEIVVLLNTDILPQKDFIKYLTPHFSDPDMFAVGCLDKSIEGESIVSRGRGVSRWENGFYIHSRGEIDRSDTAWVSGGSGAFRRSIWNELGGLDPLFNPFYWEDIDLSYRAIKAGYKILFESKSVVEHYHEEGKIKNVFSKNQIERIAYRNQFIFMWKNITDAKLIFHHIFWTKIRLIQALFSGNLNMIRGFFMALAMIPQINKSRNENRRLWKKTDRDILFVKS